MGITALELLGSKENIGGWKENEWLKRARA